MAYTRFGIPQIKTKFLKFLKEFLKALLSVLLSFHAPLLSWLMTCLLSGIIHRSIMLLSQLNELSNPASISFKGWV